LTFSFVYAIIYTVSNPFPSLVMEVVMRVVSVVLLVLAVLETTVYFSGLLFSHVNSPVAGAVAIGAGLGAAITAWMPSR
jgi:hypothetical protein